MPLDNYVNFHELDLLMDWKSAIMRMNRLLRCEEPCMRCGVVAGVVD